MKKRTESHSPVGAWLVALQKENHIGVSAFCKLAHISKDTYYHILVGKM